MLIEDLRQIAKMCGPMDLTDEAFEYGDALYKQYQEKAVASLGDERLSGYLGRKQAHLHKLAMVLSAARTSDMTITQPVLEMADTILTAIETDMPKVFANIGQSSNVQQVVKIIQFVRSAGYISRKTLWRQMVFQMGEQEFEAALNAAVSAKYLTLSMVGNDLMYKAVKEEKQP